MSSSWRSDVTALCVLYLMLERGRTFEVNDENANAIFRTMATAGLIEDMGLEWAVTDVGREAMKRAVAAQDVLRQMEIFARVDVTRQLAASEDDASNPGTIRRHLWDPRFAAENANSFDMRLAVITWLGETVTKKPVVPETIVFLQKLGNGELSEDHFWTDVRETFADVEAVVASAYKWQDADPSSTAAANHAMAAIYAAGQLEQRKRDGSSCGGCGIPLVLFEQEAANQGLTLRSCPMCSRQFNVLDETSMSCPKCSSAIYEGDARCSGCGATIDFSLPSGTVQTETIEHTETVWTSSYGYVSYGWLDPWDPFVDAVALGALYYDPWMY